MEDNEHTKEVFYNIEDEVIDCLDDVMDYWRFPAEEKKVDPNNVEVSTRVCERLDNILELLEELRELFDIPLREYVSDY